MLTLWKTKYKPDTSDMAALLFLVDEATGGYLFLGFLVNLVDDFESKINESTLTQQETN